MKFRITLTLTTQSASMMPWKQTMDTAIIKHVSTTRCGWDNTDHWRNCQSEQVFWTGGLSILVLSSTDPHISTPKLFPAPTSWDKHWSRQTIERGRSQEGNHANSLLEKRRSLQPWWWRAATEDDSPFLPYVGWVSNTLTAQRCIHHPPLQKGKSTALR